MNHLFLTRLSIKNQYICSIVFTVLVSVLCFIFSDYIGYKVVAFILLVTVSIIAMLFEIWPVLVSAILSALIWDFFFIQPRYTFHIESTEETIMFLMYFIIALINAVLTHKIRQIERYAREKEDKANMVKLYNTLINSLSHELRTPITTILGATDTLLTSNVNLSEDNRNKLLDEIANATLRLNQQVENLLNMSRLETGFIKLKKDWVDLNELVYDVINRLHQDLEFHHVIVDIEDNLPLFKLDFGLMEQVIKNLLMNALTYTPKGSTIKIIGSCVDDNCIIKIEDNGNGFPAQEIDKVFDKFYRLENTQPGGTGLGLSIVKGFIEAHDGKITLENKEPSGARFLIEIPTRTSYIKNLKNE
jgi:two-component system sensor histidine kinase KdpD